jgi:hypothetical protein
MRRRFGVMYVQGGCGVIEYIGDHGYNWTLAPDYTEREAQRIVELLNQNPELNRDEINLLLEAA